jgi:hypothetical protein
VKECVERESTSQPAWEDCTTSSHLAVLSTTCGVGQRVRVPTAKQGFSRLSRALDFEENGKYDWWGPLAGGTVRDLEHVLAQDTLDR